MAQVSKRQWCPAMAFLALAAALASAPVYGQATTYARLLGTVTDQTGAVVPGVEIEATATATNVPRLAVTDDRGNYLIDKLIPGRYDLKVELPGFKTQVSLGVRLEVTQVARVDFTLTPGEIAEQVTVTGQTTIIDTATAEVGAVIEERKILDLPIRGRDLVKLAYLTTGGVQERSEIGYAQQMYAYGGGYPSFNGLYAHSNQITLDGANNQGYVTQRPVVQPTPETVQEFKIITNNYSAEYGRVGGAVISMLSKSGTNEFHGHTWYYFRDERLDAANFFTNRTGSGKLPVNYQIFGGSMGGPIVKDRTFFHAHYERFIDDFETVGFLTVPSAAMTGGDFSGAGAGGTIPQLYNPFDVAGGERQPFPNNRIPQSMMSPVYLKAMELIPPPAPNVAGATDQNYSYPNTRNSRVNKYSIRGDHHFATDDTIFARFSWQNSPETVHTGRYGVPGAELHGVSRQFQDRSHGWQTAMSWVNPMGSSLVTELSASIWSFSWLISVPLEDRNWAEDLGYDDGHLHVSYYPDGSRGPGGLPRIEPSNYTGWRGTTVSPRTDWGWSAKYSASWRKGNHYLKFGIEHSRNLDVEGNRAIAYSGGRDQFDGYATGQIRRNEAGGVTGATFGEPWADFALGLPSSVTGNNQGNSFYYTHFDMSHYNWFVNDDWKLGPDLTLNLGVRWEQPRPPYYGGTPDGGYPTDYYYCAFDYTQANGRIDPVRMMPKGFDIERFQGPTGLAMPFGNLDTRGCFKAKWRYFAPRFGLAWRMFGTNRTVLRLGAGLTYDQEIGVLRGRTLLPATGTISSILRRGTEVPNLFLGKRLELPTQTAVGEYRTCYLPELDWEEGQVYSYNLSLQHEIFQGTKLEVAYVGNQARHIRNSLPHNVAQPEGYMQTLVGGGTLHASSATVTAGPRAWIPGDTAPRSWSGQRARRPYPQLRPNILMRPDGNMHYDSLQAKLERRFQDGLAMSMGYTWGKGMALNINGVWLDGRNSLEFERGRLKSPMRWDRTHTFYNSTIWELPFFRNADGLKKTLLGGWEATGIVTLTTGALFEVRVNRDLWNQGRRSGTRPDRIRDGSLGGGATVERWFDVSAFVLPKYDSSLCGGAQYCHQAASLALGNASPWPLRYDGVPIVDFSLHKGFAIGEHKSVDFRVEFFNALNTAIFNAPEGRIDRSSAARVSSAATARQIQLGFRFSF